MTPRFPLFAKILLWFFLNLGLLGVLFYAFVKVQFSLGLDSLLLAQAGERIHAVSEIMVEELRESQPAGWNETLRRYGAAYKARLILVRDDASLAAGEPIELPPAVRARLSERRGWFPQRSQPSFDPRRSGQPRERTEERPQPPEGAGPPPPAPGGRLEPPARREGPPPPVLPPRFLLRTENPTRYWIGVRLPLLEGQGMNRRSLTLVAVSDSAMGGGLFPDPKPWFVMGAAALGFSILFWLPLVRGITRSVSQMTAVTEQIAEGKFDVQLETRRKDELGRLGSAINRMASRLSGYVNGQKRFLGDTAHELCSPIARMQMALGILEQRADERVKPYVEDLREETQQMSTLVNELLSFSKASLKPREMKLEPVSLKAIAEQAVRREAAAGEAIHINVDGGLKGRANPELLQRALSNLLRNAFRYAGHAGPVTVSARREGDEVALTVADSGPGIPEEHLPRIFDPFYRLEPARDRETGGVGLGLTIVKTCVEACGGTVTCRNGKASGLEAVIRLKAAAG